MRILDFHLLLHVLFCIFLIVSSGCVEYYNATSGLISAIRSPADDSDVVCTYTIQTPQMRPILLTFKEFNLQQSSGCVEDYVEILEVTANDQNKGSTRLCGTAIPTPAIIISGFVQLKFRSSGHSKTTGFSADFKECMECVVRINDTEGKLQGVADSKDGQNLTDMVYLFEPQSQLNIMLEFSLMDLNNKKDCKYKWVQVKEGKSYNSRVTASFCGGSKTYTQVSSPFTVTLHTENSDDLRRFSATYRSINKAKVGAPMSVIKVESVKENPGNVESPSNSAVITAIGAVVFSVVVALLIAGLIVWRRRRSTTLSNSSELNGYGTLHSPFNVSTKSKQKHSNCEVNVVYNEHYTDPGNLKRDSVPCVVTNIDNIDCSAPSVITNIKETSDTKRIGSDNSALTDKDFAIEEGVQYSFSLTSDKRSSAGSNNSLNGSCTNEQNDERCTDDCLFHGNDNSDNVFDSATLRISDHSMIA